MAKGYSQRLSIDYNETFPLVAQLTPYELLLQWLDEEAGCYVNLMSNWLDVKLAFLNGELEKDIYVEQP